MPTVIWRGHIRLSLVSIPVRAYSAIDADAGEIHFNQLHRDCHSRIRYAKTCPLHGEVKPQDIVLGYEYEKNKYVVVEKDELESLQSAEEKILNIETIVPLDAIDPTYLTERISYLVPDGTAGEKPFVVIQKAFGEQGVAAIGRLVRNGRDSIVMVRSRHNLMMMTVLNTAEQVRDISSFSGEVPKASISSAELKLTKALFDAYFSKKFDLAQFPERYTERVRELVAAKLAGHEIVEAEPVESPPIINLMDALRKSVASAKAAPTNKTLVKPKTRSGVRAKSG